MHNFFQFNEAAGANRAQMEPFGRVKLLDLQKHRASSVNAREQKMLQAQNALPTLSRQPES